MQAVLVLATLAAQLGSGNEAAAPKIDEGICLKCSDVVPDWVREKHFQGKRPRAESDDRCQVVCAFDSKPVRLVTASCGRVAEESRHGKFNSRSEKPIPSLEDNGTSEKKDEGTIRVNFVDKDTPCEVHIRGDANDPETEAKAIALGRDVAKALTPEVVERRRTVEAIVWEQDKTGERAKAALAAWPKEVEATKTLVSLAPGFPKLIDHAGKPELPEGKQSLLLGYCPNSQSDQVVKYLKAAFPGAEGYRVAAAGTAPSCPSAVRKHDLGSVRGNVKIAGKELSAVAFLAKGRPTGDPRDDQWMFVHIYLRDKDGRLVDSKELEVGSGVGAYLDADLRMKKQKAGLSARVMVNMGVDAKKCHGTDRYAQTVEITVKDDKIVAKINEGEPPNCGCPGC